MSICLVDTSIVCEILKVPNRCGNHREIYAQMEGKIRTETLLLPMSAIIETGNHIGQNGDGRQRRKAAADFVDFLKRPSSASPRSPRHRSLRNRNRSWDGSTSSPIGPAGAPDWAI